MFKEGLEGRSFKAIQKLYIFELLILAIIAILIGLLYDTKIVIKVMPLFALTLIVVEYLFVYYIHNINYFLPPLPIYNLMDRYRKYSYGTVLVKQMLGMDTGKVYIIAASMKWPKEIENPTGYQYVTGAGQFYSIPHLYYVLAKKFNYSDIKIVLSEEVTDDDLFKMVDENIIILGGIGTNRVGGKILRKLQVKMPILKWDEDGEGFTDIMGESFRADFSGQTVLTDYGFVLKTQNPNNPKKTLLVIIGIRTIGTAAASCIVTDPERTAKVLRLFKNRRNFAFVVKAQIKDDIRVTVSPVAFYSYEKTGWEKKYYTHQNIKDSTIQIFGKSGVFAHDFGDLSAELLNHKYKLSKNLLGDATQGSTGFD